MFTLEEDGNNSLDLVLFGDGSFPKEPLLQDQDDTRRGMPKNKSSKDKATTKKREGGRKSSIVKEMKKTGHWEFEENKKYHWFLELYSNHFLNKHMRRTDKIFKVMETFLGTREAEQCRSHHQKMEKKHKNFKQILIHLRNSHYGTDDSLPVLEDLEANKITVSDILVGAEHLHNETSEIPSQDPCPEKEASLIPEFSEQKKGVQNLFSDHYQNIMDFNDLI